MKTYTIDEYQALPVCKHCGSRIIKEQPKHGPWCPMNPQPKPDPMVFIQLQVITGHLQVIER